MEIVAEWNGHLTYALRLAYRHSGEQFAEKLGISARAVAGWEIDRDKVPSLALQSTLDEALNIAPVDVKARFAQLAEKYAPQSSGAPASAPAPAVLDLATPVGLLAAASPMRVTQPALDWYESSLGELYSADNSLGPVLLLPAVSSHVRTIERMIPQTDGPLLDELLRVGAGYAEFAGWLSQDAGDLAGSRSWYDRASEWAQCADDQRMIAFVLMRRAVQAIGDGDGAIAIRHAAAAQRDSSSAGLRVRAIAAQTQALAHAQLGKAGDVARQLDIAAQLTEQADPLPLAGDPSGGGRYCELGLYLRISRAKCYLQLGQAEQAITAFGDVLTALPANYHRDRGQYLARLANASALADLPEQACTQAGESLAIAATTGSTRTLTDLRHFTQRAAKRWPTLPEVRALREMLGTLDADRKA